MLGRRIIAAAAGGSPHLPMNGQGGLGPRESGVVSRARMSQFHRELRSVKFDAAGLREGTTWLTRRPQTRDRRVVGNALDAATARETKRSLPRRLSNENFTHL